MATVAFTDTSSRVVKDVSVADARTAKVLPDRSVTKIENISYTSKNFDQVDYSIAKPIPTKQTTSIESILPFRISFTSLTIEGYTAKRPAPVGIAIVGVNNYIL